MSYSHPGSMRGHVAIITGGAQGVGKGIAAALLERGASVLLADIRDEKLAAAAEELTSHGPVEYIVADEPEAFVDITGEDFALGHEVGPRARVSC